MFDRIERLEKIFSPYWVNVTIIQKQVKVLKILPIRGYKILYSLVFGQYIQFSSSYKLIQALIHIQLYFIQFVQN